MTKTGGFSRIAIYKHAKTAVELRLRELNWRPSYGWPTDLRPFPVPPGKTYGEKFQVHCDAIAGDYVAREIAKRQNDIKAQATEDAERLNQYQRWYILDDGQQPYVYACETAGEVAFYMRCFLEEWDRLALERVAGPTLGDKK